MSDDKPRSLARKLCDVMANVGVMEKGGYNEKQKYNFVEQSAVMAKLRPMLADAGILVIPKITRTTYARETTSQYGNVTAIVQCDMAFSIINADDPDDRIDDIPWSSEGGDQGDKAVNKAGTSGEKYFLIKLFMLSEKDPDAESAGAGGAPARARQNAPVRKAEPAPRPTPPPARTEATPAGGATTPRPAPAADDPNTLRAAILAQLADDPEADGKLPKPAEDMTHEEATKTLAWLHGRRTKLGPLYGRLWRDMHDAQTAETLFMVKRAVGDARDNDGVTDEGYTALMQWHGDRQADVLKKKQPAAVH